MSVCAFTLEPRREKTSFLHEFDWLLGRQKGSIFVKMFENLLLRNHMGDEAETWHTCLGH